MPGSQFLKLTCQTFPKPMEIKKKKFQRANAAQEKVNIIKQNINAINSLQSVKAVQKNKFSKVHKNCFSFEKISNFENILTYYFKLPRKKIKQKQTGDCLRRNVHVSL